MYDMVMAIIWRARLKRFTSFHIVTLQAEGRSIKLVIETMAPSKLQSVERSIPSH